MKIIETEKRDYLSREELEDSIRGLKEADLHRLKKLAEYLAFGGLDSEDILQEAICRILSGEREKCPKDLSLINFIFGAMRSIANAERQKISKFVTYDNDKRQSIKDEQASPEACFIAREEFEQLYGLFTEDNEIQILLLYLAEGHTGEQIREAEQWTKTKYDAIRKRMRRKINTNLPKGTKS
jgi:DNA-directed RNA polymerase specialized sigma24 family protein